MTETPTLDPSRAATMCHQQATVCGVNAKTCRELARDGLPERAADYRAEAAQWTADRDHWRALAEALPGLLEDKARLDWMEVSVAKRCVELCGSPAAGLREHTDWHFHLAGIGPIAWTHSARETLDAAARHQPASAPAKPLLENTTILDTRGRRQ